MSNKEAPQRWPFKESDRHAWPTEDDLPPPGELRPGLVGAWIDVRKKRTDEEIARAKAEADADLAVESEYYRTVLEVAKGTVDRARTSAETVQKAAAAIVTLYTGVLALAFSVSDRPMPEKALFAVLLLGLTVVLSTAYLAYLPDPADVDASELSGDGHTQSERITNTFIIWARGITGKRRWSLRASVISLAVSIVFLPAPFVTLGNATVAPEETTEISWPSPDPAAGDEIELKKLLYQAQLNEVIAARSTPAASAEEFWWIWWVAFGLALAAVFLIPTKAWWVWCLSLVAVTYASWLTYSWH